VADILVREGLCAFNPSKGLHDQFSTLFAKLPQSHRRSGIPCSYEEVRKGSGLLRKAYVPNPKLEAALENLRRAIGKAGGA
jgi:hypothetical protein